MTVRDPEILEVLRDEPELLALADAVAETQRPPRPRRLARTAPRLAAVGAIVAVVVAVFLLVPDRVSHPGVIGRALAAIGNGRVLHLRTRMPSGTVFIDLKTGRRRVELFETEIWYDRATRRLHFLQRARGRVADIVVPDDLKKGDVYRPGQLDPAFAALWTGYREALASGDARLERKGAVDGRPVYWLRFRAAQGGTPGTEVAIDRRTYKPVLFREHYPHGRRFDERVLVAETTGFRASDFTRRGPNVFGLTSEGSGSSMSLPPQRPVVKAPWLTPGPKVAGLRLTAVNASTVTARGRTLHGVELIYGPLGHGPYALTIDELRRPEDPQFWQYIPRGSIAVQGGESSSGRTAQAEWTGYVVRYGVYVTIETSRGERAVLSVARTLQPAS